MTDNRNTILAVILSGLVLIAWQYFYNVPQMERQRAQTKVQSELVKKNPSQVTPSASPQAGTAPDLFVLHCPMAEADWLQLDRTVRNPYYGKSMLECGEVRRTQPLAKGNGK